MDLGLNSIIAKTSAKLESAADEPPDDEKGTAGGTPSASAAALAPEGAAMLTEGGLNGLAPSSPEKGTGIKDEVNGSLADWKFSGREDSPATPSPTRQPHTKQKKSRSTPNLQRGKTPAQRKKQKDQAPVQPDVQSNRNRPGHRQRVAETAERAQQHQALYVSFWHPSERSHSRSRAIICKSTRVPHMVV